MTKDCKTTKVEIRKVNQPSLYGALLAKMGNKTEESHPLTFDLESYSAGESLSPTVREWRSSLLKHLKNASPPPKVIKTIFKEETRELFGTKLDNKVTLRKAGHQGAHEEIVLLQFDPNFSSTEVVCRHPSCNSRNLEAAKSGKRDLYLCPHHQQKLKDEISDTLAKKNIQIATTKENPEPRQFDGYTSLIGVLEGAYHDAKKFQALERRSPMVEEAILNVRNFLIITNAVLNPDDDNLRIVLTPVLRILLLLLEYSANVPPLVDTLLYALRDVIEMILFAFGVIYSWVSIPLQSPGTRIGAGLGGTIGVILGSFLGPWNGVFGLGAGAVLGGLMGGGIYDLAVGDQRAQDTERFGRHWTAAGGAGANGQPNDQYVVYHFDGDAFGGLYLHPFLAVLLVRTLVRRFRIQ